MKKFILFIILIFPILIFAQKYNKDSKTESTYNVNFDIYKIDKELFFLSPNNFIITPELKKLKNVKILISSNNFEKTFYTNHKGKF